MRKNTMLLIYIGAYAHKYIGHEIANWWGWGEAGIEKMTYPSGAGALYNFYSFS